MIDFVVEIGSGSLIVLFRVSLVVKWALNTHDYVNVH